MRTIAPRHGAGRIGRLGRVDEHGHVLPDNDDARFDKRGKRLCADIDGWNLHAAVMVRGDNDVGRENLCRYVLRHPITGDCQIERRSK